MLKVSKEYKNVMNNPMRNRAYVSISLGVVNQTAQGSAKTNSSHNYYSNNNVFEKNTTVNNYASLEQNYTKANGEFLFPPRNNAYAQFVDNGFVSQDFLGSLKVQFDKSYDIKGFSIDFGECYPTSFKLKADNNEYTYSNNSNNFTCTDRFEDTTSIEIIPLSMVGGQQRLHIQYLLMGVGLAFKNDVVKDVSITSFVSFISSELSYNECSATIIDTNGSFDVDNDDSFMDYLEPMQPIDISFGIDINDEKQEWLQVSKSYLKDWTTKNGTLTINSTDKLSLLDSEYADGNKIETRTVYSEIENILTDLGYEPEEYKIDPFLSSVTFKNPVPVAPHKECLQLICNFARCTFFEDNNAVLNVRANFETVLDPDDLIITSSSETEWSDVQNVLEGAEVEYADLTNGSFSLNGERLFIPQSNNILKTAFVSADISNDLGTFVTNPYINLEMPSYYSYYGIEVDFGGVIPKKVKITTYGESTKEFIFEGLERHNILSDNFERFDEFKLEVLETEPNSRVVINKMSFGMVTDFKITKNDIYENPVGYKEQHVKGIKVKIYTFQNDADGNPVEVDDEVYYTYPLSNTGNYILCENQLVHNTDQARLLAEWLGHYYSNNVSYQVSFRGDPRLQANDIIYMDSKYKSNLQVEVEKTKLSFNGAFSGDLDLRRAIKLNE